LQHNLGYSFRRTLRRKVRFIEKNNEYRISISDKTSIERDIDIIIMLWKVRWGDSNDAKWYQNMMEYYYRNNLLWLSILWHDSKPISALSCIIDPVKKTVDAYITCYNPAYANISPGIVLFAYAIKTAIEHEYKIMDFSLGVYQYKLLLGSKKMKTEHVFILRKSFRSYLPYKTLRLLNRSVSYLRKLFRAVLFSEVS